MSQSGVCSACGKEIQPKQSFCPFCGAPQLALLPSRTTTHIPELPVTSPGVPNKIVQLTRIYADILVVQVAGYEQPLLVRATHNQITVGRYSPGDIAPTLDLNPYNGSVLGVSRQHAIIIRNMTGYSIKDMGSTNGTWLNDQRLVPQQNYALHSGDMLRFAQVAISVYFRIPGTPEFGETNLTVKYVTDNATIRLTLERLQTVLIPFLTALIGIQNASEKSLSNLTEQIEIKNIAVDSDKSTITIKLTGIDQTFRLLAPKISHWRETHYAELQHKLIEISGGESENNETQTHENSHEGSVRELAYEFLREKFAGKSIEELSPIVPNLLAHLETLAMSSLQIVVDNQSNHQ